ncbi:MAG: protein tyrosine phosphatase family protein [Spirulinaceae cyanobacterium]
MAKQEISNIDNFLQISDSVATSGQPTPEQIQAIGEAKYQVVVNLALATSTNALTNEQEIVEAMGMEYGHIPVIWENPTLEDLRRFFEIMSSRSHENVLVHCAANMRVSAFMYLYRLIEQDINEVDAKKDLDKIWQPNRVWQDFIEEAITHNEQISFSS